MSSTLDKVQVTAAFENFLLLPKYKISGPITKLWPIVREMKLKHIIVYENVLNKFNVGNCGIKAKVTKALAKFNHLIFHTTSRWLYIADS